MRKIIITFGFSRGQKNMATWKLTGKRFLFQVLLCLPTTCEELKTRIIIDIQSSVNLLAIHGTGIGLRKNYTSLKIVRGYSYSHHEGETNIIIHV